MSVLVISLASAAAWLSSPADSATPDSTNYLNSALHLARGHGYVTSAVEWGHSANGPIAVFAPGFPALAALLIAAGLSAREALSVLVGASFVFFALATWHLMRLALPTRLRLLALPISFGLLVQPGVREALDTALSDLFGATLALCCAILLLRSATPSSRDSRLIGTVLGVAVIGRWANLYLAVAAGFGLLLFAWHALPLREKLVKLLNAGIPAALVVAPVWLYNFMATGTLMGERRIEVRDPIAQLGQALVGASHWLVTAHQSLESLPLLATVHGGLALALVFFLASAPLFCDDYRARMGFTLAAGYVLAMVLSSSLVHYDSLTGSRFWLLVSPLITFAGIRALCSGVYSTSLKISIAGTWLVLGGHAAGVTSVAFWRELGSPRPPSGYFGEPFATSPVITRAIAMHDSQRCRLASNEEFALLPRIGTRPLQMVRSEDVSELAAYDGVPLCLVVILDAEERDVRSHVQLLAKQGRMQFRGADGAGELWVTGPPGQHARLE